MVNTSHVFASIESDLITKVELAKCHLSYRIIYKRKMMEQEFKLKPLACVQGCSHCAHWIADFLRWTITWKGED